jgi:hypothetical protein
MNTLTNATPELSFLPEGGKVLKRFRRELPHKLTRDEVHDYGQKLAGKEREWSALDEKRKGIAQQYRGDLAKVEADIQRLTAAVDTGKELRNTEVVNVLVGSQVFTYSLESGEVVDQRAADHTDTQEDMFPALEDDDFLPGDASDGDVPDLGAIADPDVAQDEKPKGKRKKKAK